MDSAAKIAKAWNEAWPKLAIGDMFSTDVLIDGQVVKRWFEVVAHTSHGFSVIAIDDRREVPLQL